MMAPHSASSGTPPEPRLHVVEVVDGLSTGGAQVLMAMRARHRARFNLEIDVVALAERDEDTRYLFEAENVRIHHVFGNRPDRTGDLKRLQQLVALLRQLKPDVVHTHLRTSNIVATLAAKLAGVPSVTTLHSIHPEPELPNPRRDFAEKWLLRLFAARVLAVGPTVAETHQARMGNKIIEISANPVEFPVLDGTRAQLQQQARARLDLPFKPDGEPWVVGIGRLTRNKAFDSAIEIVRLTRERVPGVRFLIAGDGNESSALREQIAAQGLEDVVFMLGRSEQVSDLMFASDAFLLSSVGEGLPLVLLEAMARRLPIVSTPVGDVPWLLENGHCGALYPFGDVQSGADQLAEVLLGQEKANQFAERALERAKSRFSVDQWLHDTRRVYLELSGHADAADTRLAELPES